MKPYTFFSNYNQPSVQKNQELHQNNPNQNPTVGDPLLLTNNTFQNINLPKINIIHFQRHHYSSAWSIEKVFNEIRRNLSDIIKVTVFEVPFQSKGIILRIQNIINVHKKRSLINHITGDIHYVALGLPKNNTILTIHDLGFMKQHRGLRRIILWLFWIYLPVLWVKKVVAISNSTKAEILKYTRCNANKIVVIHNFLPPYFAASPKEFNVRKPVILQIGTKFNKNIERLIEALHGLRCRLLIIGELQEKHLQLLYKYQIEFENRLNLVEEELMEAYRECDLLSFCSLLEGFGLPILEAQATGRPVVTSNLYSMPEVAGNAACIVDPYSVNSIRHGIEKVIFDHGYRDLLIRNGFENIKRFNVESVARQYTELYCELYVELM